MRTLGASVAGVFAMRRPYTESRVFRNAPHNYVPLYDEEDGIALLRNRPHRTAPLRLREASHFGKSRPLLSIVPLVPELWIQENTPGRHFGVLNMDTYGAPYPLPWGSRQI